MWLGGWLIVTSSLHIKTYDMTQCGLANRRLLTRQLNSSAPVLLVALFSHSWKSIRLIARTSHHVPKIYQSLPEAKASHFARNWYFPLLILRRRRHNGHLANHAHQSHGRGVFPRRPPPAAVI